ncbi:hypothetical protein NE237_014568 [Protea cynaroides]|uniref:Uncharacterized protein n=1 Tax=Protea cynaroides TaxID=273540 RepID=A0A9Q0KCC6_9MAGN|nr:hypothetical protein NE237_014568 [Protea cynaroides]
MTGADDGSSGRSRMMRKSHVRFPEKGVATYWSFDQPPPVNSALGPPLTLPMMIQSLMGLQDIPAFSGLYSHHCPETSSPVCENLVSKHEPNSIQKKGFTASVFAFLGRLMSGRWFAIYFAEVGLISSSPNAGWFAIYFAEGALSLDIGRLFKGYGMGVFSYVGTSLHI